MSQEEKRSSVEKETKDRKADSKGGKILAEEKQVKEKKQEKLIKITQKKLDFLNKRLEEKKAEAAEYLDMLKRLKAEFENFKKRMLREQTHFMEMASQNIITQLLPVVDDLERALKVGAESENLDKIVEGVNMTYTDMMKILKEEGVEVIDPKGQKFDPAKHEAMMQVESNEHEEDEVVEVYQKGYSLKGKVIRPARVSVARKRKPSQAQE